MPDFQSHAEKRMDDLYSMVNVIKGELAANTAFTRCVDAKVDGITGKQKDIIASMHDICDKLDNIDTTSLKEATGVLVAMKGTWVVAGWIGVFAKWVATIAAAVGIFYAAWHWGQTK